MDFSDKEMRVLLQALYRFRGEVSGASQSEQNKAALVATVIDKIEASVGPLTAERTRFDREMDESLAVLTTGKMGQAKSVNAMPKLDNGGAAPKVKGGAPKGALKSSKTAKAKPVGKAKPAAAPAAKAKKATAATKATGASKKR